MLGDVGERPKPHVTVNRVVQNNSVVLIVEVIDPVVYNRNERLVSNRFGDILRGIIFIYFNRKNNSCHRQANNYAKHCQKYRNQIFHGFSRQSRFRLAFFYTHLYVGLFNVVHF